MSQPKVLAQYKSTCNGNHLVNAEHKYRSKGRYILCVRCNFMLERSHWEVDGRGKLELTPIDYTVQYLVKEWP